MIIAHALFFFHDGTNSAFRFVEKFLNSTVFTIFVFVYGQSLSRWLDRYAHEHTKSIIKRSLNRAATLYLAYIAMSVAALATSKEALSKLIPMLTLLAPPIFTEYMVLFVVLALFTPLLRPLFRYTRMSFLLTFIIGAFFYTIGIILYEVTVPEYLISIKALLAGGGGLLRFPVFFYLPVVLWGLWWQHDLDHNTQDKAHSTNHLYILITSVFITVFGAIVIRFVTFPILNPAVRWPPSVVFLTMGISVVAILSFIMTSVATLGSGGKRILAYFGRDALDLWVSHILLLFLYKYFVSVKIGNPVIVFVAVITLMALTILLSSFSITNQIRFPFRVTFEGATRFRKRYALYAVAAFFLVIFASGTSGSSYGNSLSAPAFIVEQKLPSNTKATLSAQSTWYVKRAHIPQSLELVIAASSDGQRIRVNPDLVTIRLNSAEQRFSGIAAADGALHFTKPVDGVAPGTYMVSVEIDNSDEKITTNTVKVHISEPLMVAWTLDWEGWDVPDDALQKITELTTLHPTFKFSHFVNPRTFMPGILDTPRRSQLVAFLNDRRLKNEEIAMHLHMHYDLVAAAGVPVKRTPHWGLRSEEGYDVPTSEYSPAEFRQIVETAKRISLEAGLPPMTGYRAGGWFLSSAQLNELSSLGFIYDSSGRTKPGTGAFTGTPWDLPAGAQPYFPSAVNQNISSPGSPGILEIPTNGLSTYDQTVEMLTAHINEVYKGGILVSPLALVFVSHPQFYSQEFWKIPEVLKNIVSFSHVAGQGPAVFVTTAEISELWHSLYK